MKTKVSSTRLGTIIGRTESGVDRFLGIPFAANSRFSYAHLSEQIHDEYDASIFRGTPLQLKTPWMNDSPEPSEDALYLNIWRKSDSAGKLPVIFWIYGGGFEGGTASSPMYSGLNFVDQGKAIFVSANYRVGFLGFGYLPNEIPSNIGVSDIIKALEWVSKNIETFGGDPNNVTVIGQSAGGFIAGALSSIPEAKKYFTRLVMLSGAASRIVPLGRAEELTQAWKDDLINSGYSIQNAPAEAILSSQAKVISKDIGIRNATQPNALGVVLDFPIGLMSGHPFESLTSKDSVDVVIGFTDSEIASFRRYAGKDFEPKDADSLKQEIASWGIAIDRVKSIFDFYEARSGSDLGKLRELILTDWIYKLPAIRLAFARRFLNLRTYLFEFSNTDESPLGHGEDLKFLFKPLSELSRTDSEVASNWLSLLLEFAKTGQMNVADMSKGLHFTNLSHSEDIQWGQLQSVLDLWQGVERP